MGCGPETRQVSAPERQRTSPVEALQLTSPDQAIVAIGQLEPAGGVIAIIAPPGDQIAALEVAENDPVQQGKLLVRLVGDQVRERELELARLQLREAQEALAAEKAIAQEQLKVAKLGVEAQSLRLTQAEEEQRRGEQPGGELDLLIQKVELARERLAKGETAQSKGLATPIMIQEQRLAVEQAEAEREGIRRKLQAAVDGAKIAFQAAQQETAVIERRIEGAGATAQLQSLEKKVEVLEEQIKVAKIKSPIDGKVLSVELKVGHPTTGVPVMRVADLTKMICRAEVPNNIVDQIKPGNRAAMTGGGLQEEIFGTVESIGQMVGAPRLSSSNPRAMVDWSSVYVVIAIDDQDHADASKYIHSQVDVWICKSSK